MTSRSGIPPGWTAAAWADYLEHKAKACRPDHPALAATYDARVRAIRGAGAQVDWAALNHWLRRERADRKLRE